MRACNSKVIDSKTYENVFGGAYRAQRVPGGLKIVQQGKNLSHFEIIPNKTLSLSQYQALLNKVALIGI